MENVFGVMEARKMIFKSILSKTMFFFNSLCLQMTNCNPVTSDGKTEMKGKFKYSKFTCC